MPATTSSLRYLMASLRSSLLIFLYTLLAYGVFFGHPQGLSFATGLEVTKDAVLSTTTPACDTPDRTPEVPVSPLTQDVVVSRGFLENTTDAYRPLPASVSQPDGGGAGSKSRASVAAGHQGHHNPQGPEPSRHIGGEFEPEALFSFGGSSSSFSASPSSLGGWEKPQEEPEGVRGADDRPHSRKRRAVVQKVVEPWPCRLAPGKNGQPCPEGSTDKGFFYIPIQRVCKTFHSATAEASYIWATRYLESRTRIRFVNRTDEDKYVELTCNPPFCYASVGSSAEAPELNIYGSMCPQPGSILHELLHVLGLSHEHNREERDRYISVNALKASRDFGKLTDVTTYGSYDFASLMHYSRHPGPSVVQENPFIVKNDTFTFLADYPKVFPSDCDWFAIESLYPGSVPGKTQCTPNCVDTSLRPTDLCLRTSKKAWCEIWCAAGNDIYFGDEKCTPIHPEKSANGVVRGIRNKEKFAFHLPAVKREPCVPYLVLYEKWRAELLALPESGPMPRLETDDNDAAADDDDDDDDKNEPTEKATTAALCPRVKPSLEKNYAKRLCKERCENCVKKVFQAFHKEQEENTEDENDADVQWDPAPAVRECVSVFSKSKSYICVWSGVPHFATGGVWWFWWCLLFFGSSVMSFRS